MYIHLCTRKYDYRYASPHCTALLTYNLKILKRHYRMPLGAEQSSLEQNNCDDVMKATL